MTDFLYGHVATPFDDMDVIENLVIKALERLVRPWMVAHPKSAYKAMLPSRGFVYPTSHSNARFDIDFAMGKGVRSMMLSRERHDDVDPAFHGFRVRLGNDDAAAVFIRAVLRYAQVVAAGGVWLSDERGPDAGVPTLVTKERLTFLDLYREPHATLGAADLAQWEAARWSYVKDHWSEKGDISDIIEPGMDQEHVNMVIHLTKGLDKMTGDDRHAYLAKADQFLAGLVAAHYPLPADPKGATAPRRRRPG